jgi:serine O-acetyltransferase
VFQNLREDWQTANRNILWPGLWVMAVYRFGCWRYGIGWRWLRMPFSLAYKVAFALVQVASGTELPCETRIGRRLRIDHSHGIVISGDASLGDDVILRNGVTIGLRRAPHRGSPSIGNRVDIGAGAKILGPISIGDDSVIGANAVVLMDVPPHSIAVGVPAKIKPRKNVEQWRNECASIQDNLETMRTVERW